MAGAPEKFGTDFDLFWKPSMSTSIRLTLGVHLLSAFEVLEKITRKNMPTFNHKKLEPRSSESKRQKWLSVLNWRIV